MIRHELLSNRPADAVVQNALHFVQLSHFTAISNNRTCYEHFQIQVYERFCQCGKREGEIILKKVIYNVCYMIF